MEPEIKVVSMQCECRELARFYQAVENQQLTVMQHLIEKNPQLLNQRIACNSYFCDLGVQAIGFTLLHVAYMKNNINAYRLLLSVGADVTLKNYQGSTVVHQIVERSYNQDLLSGRLKNPFLEVTLIAQYDHRIPQNPCNLDGITHLHAACIANYWELVLKLLIHGDACIVNQAVDMDSLYFPGYTLLHFALRFSEMCTLKTIKILLKYGADINIQDKYGQTALDILIEKYEHIMEMVEIKRNHCPQYLQKAFVDSEKITNFILGACELDHSRKLKIFKLRSLIILYLN